jgi:hypothetical protein
MTIRFAIPFAIPLMSGVPVFAAETIIEECHGTETVKIGTSEPRTVSYNLTFKADLSNKTYCYGPCRAQETYPIADAASSPLKLADLDKGGQVRHLVFDRASGKLTDYQIINAGLAVVIRNAAAICKSTKL